MTDTDHTTTDPAGPVEPAPVEPAAFAVKHVQYTGSRPRPWSWWLTCDRRDGATIHGPRDALTERAAWRRCHRAYMRVMFP